MHHVSGERETPPVLLPASHGRDSLFPEDPEGREKCLTYVCVVVSFVCCFFLKYISNSHIRRNTEDKETNRAPGRHSSKESPAMQETWVQSLGQEEPPDREMATYSSSLTERIPWTEEPFSWTVHGIAEVST